MYWLFYNEKREKITFYCWNSFLSMKIKLMWLTQHVWVTHSLPYETKCFHCLTFMRRTTWGSASSVQRSQESNRRPSDGNVTRCASWGWATPGLGLTACSDHKNQLSETDRCSAPQLLLQQLLGPQAGGPRRVLNPLPAFTGAFVGRAQCWSASCRSRRWSALSVSKHSAFV